MATPRLQHSIVRQLNAEAVYVSIDDDFVYAACTDMKVRVWARKDWQLVAELGETSSPPLAVHVDEEQVFATCEKRVYVWNKKTWGMIGWFELSYNAVTSTLRGDSLYVGAKEGRLVSIKKDTHDTSSWQLFKSDIGNLWSDSEIICTSTSKDEPVIWKLQDHGSPTELKRLDKKDKGAKLVGNNSFIISGLTTSEIKIWDRVDWGHVRTLEPVANSGIGSMWVNQMYLIASSEASAVTIWDVRKGSAIGSFKVDGVKILHVRADKQHVFIATGENLIVISLTLGRQPLDLSVEDNPVISQTVLKTSPYDVLESVLDLQREGDEQLEKGAFHDAVAEYEQALQLLIDNTHALLEVPSERESLTYELNERLGYSLLRAKIQELDQITRDISFVSAEFDEYGRSSKDEAELDKMWSTASRAIKESRVLSEAQAGHILSYQLAYATDVLDSELKEAKRKFEEYQEKINEALTLTQSIRSEWRWLERKRTPLAERESFLDNAIKTLKENIASAGDDREVVEILGDSLSEFTRLSGQIKKILDATQSRPQKLKLSKEETADAITGLLGVLDKRMNELENIDNESERSREKNQILEALQQALEAAELNKMKREASKLSSAIATLEETSETEPAKPEETKPPKEEVKPEETKPPKEEVKPEKKKPREKGRRKSKDSSKKKSKDSSKKKRSPKKKASKKSE